MSNARTDFEAALGLQNGVINNFRHQVQSLTDSAFGPSD